MLLEFISLISTLPIKNLPTNKFYLTFEVYNKIVFWILFYIISLTIIVACIYCNIYFVKKIIAIFVNKSNDKKK